MSHEPNVEKPFVKNNHIVIDLARWQVYCCGNLLEVSTLHFELLTYLYHHIHHVCCYDELLENVWGYTACVESDHVVRLAISRLRKDFQVCSCCHGNTLQIRTVRGIGYCLETHHTNITVANGYTSDTKQIQTRYISDTNLLETCLE